MLGVHVIIDLSSHLSPVIQSVLLHRPSIVQVRRDISASVPLCLCCHRCECNLTASSPQVNHLGWLAPTGAPWIDYFLSDAVFMCVNPSVVSPRLFTCPFVPLMSCSQCLQAA